MPTGLFDAKERFGVEQYRMDAAANLVRECVRREEIPGAVLLIGNRGKTLCHEAWGWAQLIPEKLPMTKDTLFDIASLTKIVGTWTGIAMLLQEGRLSLDDKLCDMLHHQKMHPSLREITLWNLLTHTAGLIPFRHPSEELETRKERIDELFMIPAERERGAQAVYSDLSFIYLGEILAEAMGEKQNFVVDEICNALGMYDTCYLPSKNAYCAATEVREGETIRGWVHDTTAHMLGGVAGHAGLFSTAADLGAFCAAILPPTQHPAFREEWLKRSYENQTAHLGENRALGWIAYVERPEGNIVGHTGFTGTSIWMDTASGDYVILLTNRVHPTRENRAHLKLRREVFKVLFDAEL